MTASHKQINSLAIQILSLFTKMMCSVLEDLHYVALWYCTLGRKKNKYKHAKPAPLHHTHLILPNRKIQKVQHQLLQSELIRHDDQCEPIN